MSLPKIAILGSINEDFIIHKGKQKHSYGGILYNLVALAALLPEAEVFPFAFLGDNVWPRVSALTEGLKNVNWNGCRKLRGKSNRVLLLYLPNGEKKEILKHPVPKFGWPDLRPALQTNALLLNFISGWEISPRLFQKLRKEYSGIIHVDIHSLLLGRKENGERFQRLPKNWQAFLGADFVQMNQREWELVAGLPFNRENLKQFCRRWKSKRWKGILVTLAEKGAVLACRETSLKIVSFPAPRVKNPEQTGAGDFFAAGFLSSFLQKKSPERALRKAVRTASWKCRYQGIENVLRHRAGLNPFLTTSRTGSKLSV